MWAVETLSGREGLPMIRLSSSVSRAAVEVYLFGATLTSWTNTQGKENIFVSSLAQFNGVKAIRGGIPVVFPQFGQPLKEMTQHGFARTTNWILESKNIADSACAVTFSLTDSDVTMALWPHAFKLEYTITLSEESLTCTLVVRNLGSSSFTCHTLLHTYLSVPAIEGISVTGFKDRSYVDKVENSNIGLDVREVATINCEVDRVMTGSVQSPLPSVTLNTGDSDQRVVTVTVTATLHTHSHSSTYTPPTTTTTHTHTHTTPHTTHTHTPCPHDIVFWNPWVDKAKALADLGDEDYLSFVCIEPGTVSDWVSVTPVQTLTLSQVLTSTSV